jgi:hypothetical protein
VPSRPYRRSERTNGIPYRCNVVGNPQRWKSFLQLASKRDVRRDAPAEDLGDGSIGQLRIVCGIDAL